MSKRTKHLSFIQAVIARMNTNSFMIKGWTVTLVSALFALAALGSNDKYALITYLVIPAFWYLDGTFLWQERRYRDLYNHVRTLQDGQIDFNMNASGFRNTFNDRIKALKSETIAVFYGISIATTLIVMYLLKR